MMNLRRNYLIESVEKDQKLTETVAIKKQGIIPENNECNSL